MASKKKEVDPLDQLGKDLAAEHTLEKAKAEGAPEILEPEDENREGFVPEFEKVDGETAHDRNLEKLEDIAIEAEFESGTLVGDLRDLMLRLYKERAKNWSQCSASEQRDIVAMSTDVAKKVIKKVVRVVAEQDANSVHATLKGYNAGEGFDIKLKANADEETALELFRMQGHEVIIISADARKFEGQKRDADIEEDQAPLPFSDPKPEPQQSDGTETDLADAAEDETVAEAVAEAEVPEIVVDDDGQPLTPEQEAEWSTVDFVTRTEPEFPELNQTWVNPEDGDVRYWHGAKGWQNDEWVDPKEINEAE
jgi:hypothetical protein